MSAETNDDAETEEAEALAEFNFLMPGGKASGHGAAGGQGG